MEFLDRIVEKRISEAIERGEFSDLPGQGRPLCFDDEALIPPELRMAYRILRNAGFVPPEVTTLRDIADLEARVETIADVGERNQALRKLQLLRLRLEASGRFHAFTGLGSDYSAKLMKRLGDQDGSAAHGGDRREDAF